MVDSPPVVAASGSISRTPVEGKREWAPTIADKAKTQV
jgi:hypothetical protein